ncbi:MAG: hypothetical protein M9916_00860 [Crocinitomicaceae bacterium]|nr:hypothetical protein [Crocinitomicaceae bacterium]
MNSKQASEAISAGYVINVNLPDWKSATNSQATQTAEQTALKEKQKRQYIVAGGILVVLLLAILFIKPKRA